LQFRDLLWSTYFNLKQLKISKRKYQFDHSILTDGVSVSAQFATKGKLEKQSRKKLKKIKLDIKDEEEVDKIEVASLKNRCVVGVDPGKHNVLYLTADDQNIEKRMKYTNIQRRVELGRKDFQRSERKIKTEMVQQAENQISNSRASTTKGFQEYLKARFKVQDLLYSHYSNPVFHIHNWWSYRKKQKSEQKLVNSIKEKFGTDAVLAYGNWSRSTQMRGLIPSPTCGIKRMLSQHFTIIDTPEYHTTKLCSKCHTGIMEPVKNKTITKKKWNGTSKVEVQCEIDVRGLRRCNNAECAVLFNRDYNAAMNIRQNLLHYIDHGCWADRFMKKSNNQPIVSGSDV